MNDVSERTFRLVLRTNINLVYTSTIHLPFNKKNELKKICNLFSSFDLIFYIIKMGSDRCIKHFIALFFSKKKYRIAALCSVTKNIYFELTRRENTTWHIIIPRLCLGH